MLWRALNLSLGFHPPCGLHICVSFTSSAIRGVRWWARLYFTRLSKTRPPEPLGRGKFTVLGRKSLATQ